MPLGLIGKKLGQTRVYDAAGVLVPVTVVLAGPNRVLQVRNNEADGYCAVQLAFGPQKPQRLTLAALGHLVKHGVLDQPAADKARDKGEKTPLTAVVKIREFRNFSQEVKTGDLVGPTLFAVGDFIDAIGVTKGKGFEGVVKRHHFRGGDSTHGSKGWHRRGGAIGQRLFPGTVMRGMKMPGHMGRVQRTVQNLEIVQVRETDNLLLIKGAIPGANGDYVVIREAKKIPQTLARKRAADLAAAKAAIRAAQLAKAKSSAKPSAAKK
jgi:large subunit ribosomal protein L3